MEYPLYTGEEGHFRVKLGYTLLGFSGFLFLMGVVFPSIFSFVPIFSSPFFLAGFYFIRSGRKLIKGYLGEVQVLEALRKMDGYVISDVVLPGGGGNIDHVFVSRRGVFAIEVKNYDVDVEVRGDNWWVLKPHGRTEIGSISKAIKRRAFELSRFIEESTGNKIFVVPVIVFTGKGAVSGSSTVPVLTLESLVSFIRTRPPLIDDKTVLGIVSALEESGHMVLGGENEARISLLWKDSSRRENLRARHRNLPKRKG